MRVLDEQEIELQRPNPERVIERNIGAQHITAKAAEVSEVVALLEARPLAEQCRDLPNREKRRHKQGKPEDAAGRHKDDPQALVARSGW